MDSHKFILIMKIANFGLEDSTENSSLSETSPIEDSSKALPMLRPQLRKYGPAAFKCRAERKLRAQKAFHPLSSPQTTALSGLFARLIDVETLLEREVSAGRPGDGQLGAECIQEVTASSMMKRRLLQRAYIA